MGIEWKAWGTTVKLQVTDPQALPSAYRLVRGLVAEAERAADVDRRRAELSRVVRGGGRPTRISPTLSALVALALDVAADTDGAVDPTVGASTIPLRRALARAAGGHHDLLIPTCSALPYLAPRPAPGWGCVTWGEHALTVPAAVSLDLTATAKARTARLAAGRVAERLDVGALVEIGGDVATAGAAPGRSWRVVPEHGGGAVLELPGGAALAACRACSVVDPLTGRTVAEPWRTIVVRADDVVTAKGAALAALIRGEHGEIHAPGTTAGPEAGTETLTRGAARSWRAAPRGAGQTAQAPEREPQAG